MTEPLTQIRTKRKKFSLTLGQLCFGWFSLFCLLLILRNAEIAIEYMNRGLRLCAKTVIPALFPFMVISELIVSGGIGTLLLRPVSRPLKRLFRLPEEGCCTVILGMLCGFPVGAKCAVSALERGTLTREEAERVLLFSSNPSSAFLINAVGVSLWGNRRFGTLLWIASLISQLTVGLLFTHLTYKKEAKIASSDTSFHSASLSGIKLFTEAVRSSCFGMLLICAYVIFFSALVGTLNLMLEQFGATATVKAILFGVFELSGGMSAAASLSVPLVGALLCAFAAGWSGLSVHCQLLSICDGHGLHLKRYLVAKLLQSALCVLLVWLFLRFDPSALIPDQGCVLQSLKIRQ